MTLAALEYFADDYSGEVRRTPGVLSSALVKDCLRHGMVGIDGKYTKAIAERGKDEKAFWRRELGVPNITAKRAPGSACLFRQNSGCNADSITSVYSNPMIFLRSTPWRS